MADLKRQRSTYIPGSITIHASDDCLNAANSDLSGYAFSLNIYGGTLVMDTTSGDGVDSNGSLTISGGTLVVWSANTADNQPLDADGTITISGGTVLAAGGSNGMGMNLSASHPYVIYGSASGMGSGMGGNFPGEGRGNGNFPDRSDQSGYIPAPPSGGFSGDTNDTKGGFTGGNPYGGFPGNAGSSVSISSGSTITLKDSSGNTVYSGEALCSASVLIFSSSALENGEASYSLRKQHRNRHRNSLRRRQRQYRRKQRKSAFRESERFKYHVARSDRQLRNRRTG